MRCDLFFYKNVRKFSLALFCLFLLFHIYFQLRTEHIKPNLHIVPEVPNQQLVDVVSLGDKEFYFRFLALRIQSAGDTFGRFPPLKDYDYKKLYDWFTFLDTLNNKSTIIPFIASYHFSQTQNKNDTKYIVKYLAEHSEKDLDKNWWWMHQAIMMAQFVLGDLDLALKLAYKLSENNAQNAPLWTKQYPAFVHLKMNDSCSAFFIINKMLQDHEKGERQFQEQEIDFMHYFIKKRINKLKSDKFNPQECQDQKNRL